MRETGARVFDEFRRREALDRLQQFPGRFYRVLLLPQVIEKRLLVDVLVSRNVSPEFALLQILEVKVFGADRGLGMKYGIHERVSAGRANA